MKKTFLASCFVLLIITVGGCNLPSSAIPTPIVVQDQVMTLVARELTEVSMETAAAPKTPTTSPFPSATETPFATPIQAATPIPTIKPVDFTGHQVYVSYLEGEVMQVSITVPNGIKGDYSAIFGDKPYTCFTYTSKNLDRLICHGAILKSELTYPFRVFINGNKNPIFERTVTVPIPPV